MARLALAHNVMPLLYKLVLQVLHKEIIVIFVAVTVHQRYLVSQILQHLYLS